MSCGKRNLPFASFPWKTSMLIRPALAKCLSLLQLGWKAPCNPNGIISFMDHQAKENKKRKKKDTAWAIRVYDSKQGNEPAEDYSIKLSENPAAEAEDDLDSDQSSNAC